MTQQPIISVLLAVDGLAPAQVQRITEAVQGWAQLTAIAQEAPEGIFRPLLAHAQYVIGWPDPAWLAGTPVRVLHTGSAGFDAYLGHGLDQRDRFTFCNARGVYSIGIAEHVLAIMLAFCRQLPRHGRDQQARRFANPLWDGKGNPYGELNGAAACIVGLGHVGAEVARKCAAMDMRVIAVDREGGQTPDFVEHLYRTDELHRAVADADHVILTVSGGPATQDLADRSLFDAMRRGAYLYNVSRGRVVNEDNLIAALRSGQLAGAGLDVFRQEPLPAGSPLWALDNVIITPHVAGFAGHYEDRLSRLFADNLLRYRDGKPLNNVIAELSSTDMHSSVEAAS